MSNYLCRRLGRLVVAIVLAFGSTGIVHAASIVNLYNGPNVTIDGENFLDARIVALQLRFSSFALRADDAINVLEDIDVSVHSDVETTGDLSLVAPSVSFHGDVFMGHGLFAVRAEHLFVHGVHLSAPVFTSISGSINLMDNSSLRIVGVPEPIFGNPSPILDADLSLGSGSSIQFVGSAFELDTGLGFESIATGVLGVDSGTLRGLLASGDPFQVSFIHDAGSSSIMLSEVPIPPALWLLLSGCMLLGWFKRSR